MAKTTTGTDDGDGLAWGEVGSLDGLPDGDTCAEEGSGSLEGESVGDGGDVSSKGDGVLLEGSVLGEAWWVGWTKGVVEVVVVMISRLSSAVTR